MTIVYRDGLGVVSVKVDEYGIVFNHDSNGNTSARFSDGAKEYGIDPVQIIAII